MMVVLDQKNSGIFPLIGAKFICSSYQYPRRARVLQEREDKQEKPIQEECKEMYVNRIDLFSTFVRLCF